MTARALLAGAVVAAVVVGSAGGGDEAWAGVGAVKGRVTSGAAAAPAAGAVVMIDGPSLPAGAEAKHAAIDQKNDTFVPHVLAVAAGTTVDFPNSDPRLHNVFSASPAKKFDLGMYGPGETKSVTFDTPGVVRVLCNVHPKMEAFIVVHANPYVAVTDAQGFYAISGVPAGNYQLRVWHERLPEKQTAVSIREGQVQPLDVKLEARP